jgi:uncharacterized protein YbjT (DUF2867 family)
MKALILGGTGLVGSYILDFLIHDTRISEIISFSRRKLTFKDSKLKEIILNFDDLSFYEKNFQGSVLFLSLGTTRSKAGGKENQFKVDFEYQLKAAQLAKSQGVEICVLVSSTGAREDSPFFYLKMKGELEKRLVSIQFKKLIILRPGPLKGMRKEQRRGEVLFQKILNLFPQAALPAHIRPIDAKRVAQIALNSIFVCGEGIHVLETHDLWNGFN